MDMGDSAPQCCLCKVPPYQDAELMFVCRIPETLPSEVLTKMGAPARSSTIPEITPRKLEEYDAFLFGIPTRYGNFPAQWKAFIDHTGGQWQSGSYWGKYVGVFVSTSTPGGGQESTVISAMSTLAHHGMIYVPLGFKTASEILSNIEEVRGGSPWGAGTFAVCCNCSEIFIFAACSLADHYD